MGDVLMFPSRSRFALIRKIAGEIFESGYEPRTRLDRARAQIRRERLSAGFMKSEVAQDERKFEEAVMALAPEFARRGAK